MANYYMAEDGTIRDRDLEFTTRQVNKPNSGFSLIDLIINLFLGLVGILCTGGFIFLIFYLLSQTFVGILAFFLLLACLCSVCE